jgi:hypothetical protein
MVFAINSRDQPRQGSAITRFLGRGVRGALPNSLDRSSNWGEKVRARGEIRQNHVDKKGRTVGKKEIFAIREPVKLQNLKTKKWNADGTIAQVRVSADGTIASYDIETSDGTMTTRHRRYIQKVQNPEVNNEGRQSTEIADRARAQTALSSHKYSTWHVGWWYASGPTLQWSP